MPVLGNASFGVAGCESETSRRSAQTRNEATDGPLPLISSSMDAVCIVPLSAAVLCAPAPGDAGLVLSIFFYHFMVPSFALDFTAVSGAVFRRYMLIVRRRLRADGDGRCLVHSHWFAASRPKRSLRDLGWGKARFVQWLRPNNFWFALAKGYFEPINLSDQPVTWRWIVYDI